MCLTLPAQIITLNGAKAKVKTHSGQIQEVLVSAVSEPRIHDWLMINGNLAVQKISQEEAEELINILK